MDGEIEVDVPDHTGYVRRLRGRQIGQWMVAQGPLKSIRHGGGIVADFSKSSPWLIIHWKSRTPVSITSAEALAVQVADGLSAHGPDLDTEDANEVRDRVGRWCIESGFASYLEVQPTISFREWLREHRGTSGGRPVRIHDDAGMAPFWRVSDEDGDARWRRQILHYTASGTDLSFEDWVRLVEALGDPYGHLK